jgi:hypothetical protein
MRVVIDKRYEKYRNVINKIPANEIPVNKVFCNNRNIVYLIVLDHGERWVVKKYKRPTLANCVIYTWFRTNKAKRSFMYAYRLLSEGIETAYPIAYIEIPRHGFFHTGYYICEYQPYERLDKSDIKDEYLEKCFIDYAENLYNQGIVNYDLNPSNILVHRDEDGHYKFSLIDINRIHFKQTNWRKHIHAFLKCINYGSDEGNKSKRLFQMNILMEYCIECGINIYHVAIDMMFYSVYKTVINHLHQTLKNAIRVVVNNKNE